MTSIITEQRTTRKSTTKAPNAQSLRVTDIAWRDRFGAYLRHHRELARESLLRQLKTPLSSFMTYLAIGIALSLPAVLSVFLANAKLLANQWGDVNQISLYLKKDADRDKLFNLQQRLNERQDISVTQVISSEDALEEFKANSSFADALSYLSENPLPAVIVIRPSQEHLTIEQLEALASSLRQYPQIDQIQMDLTWLRRLNSMISLGDNVVWVLALLFGLSVLLVIGNTIRLTIESRREEIIVVKLVGGTNAFVKRPFLYTGVWFGLGGGLLAWVIVNACLFLLSKPVSNLTELYHSDFQLQGLGAGLTFMLLLTGVLLGLMGAWLAVDRYIRRIEPT